MASPGTEINGFKFARLFDGIDEATRKPYFDQSRQSLAASDRLKVTSFLQAGAVVRVAFGKDVDPFTGETAVPIGSRTDGRYIWPIGLEYFVKRHGIGPDPEFLDYMRNLDFEIPDIDQNLSGALEAITSFERSGGNLQMPNQSL